MSKKNSIDHQNDSNEIRNICGIVMPISSIDSCSESHWLDVKRIIESAIGRAGMLPNLVSDGDDIAIIQKRIIQNLYNNPIVICDVSGKNPNVMFELGMRLAFDKPTIIIKDDKTTYSFDTGSIEHLPYPRDLRFNQINEFIEKLSEKLISMQKSVSEGAFNSFLKEFGQFKVATLTETELPLDKFILEELGALKSLVSNSNYIKSGRNTHSSILETQANKSIGTVNFKLYGKLKKSDEYLYKTVDALKGVTSLELSTMSSGEKSVRISYDKTQITDHEIDIFVLNLLREDELGEN